MVWKKLPTDIKLNGGVLQLFTTERGFPVFVATSSAYKNKPCAETEIHKNVFDVPFVLVEPTRAYVNNAWVAFVSPVKMPLAVPVISTEETRSIAISDLERVIEQGYEEQLSRAQLASESREKHLKVLRRNYMSVANGASVGSKRTPGGYGVLQDLQRAGTLLDLRKSEDTALGLLLAGYNSLNK